MLNRVTFFFSTKLRIFTMCPRSVGVAKTDRAREREGREASVAFPLVHGACWSGPQYMPSPDRGTVWDRAS